MTKKNIWNYLCLFGILSVVFFAIHHIVGEKYYGKLYFPYDTIQFLTAVGSPSRFIALPLLLASRIFGCIGCLAVYKVLKGEVNDDLGYGLKAYAAFRIAVSVSELLFPTSIEEHGLLHYGPILGFLMIFLFLPLLFTYTVLICLGTFQKNGDGRRNILPGILLAVWLAPVIVLLIIDISSNELTGILGGVGTVFFYGTVIHGALLGVYGYALGKESSLSANGEGKTV